MCAVPLQQSLAFLSLYLALTALHSPGLGSAVAGVVGKVLGPAGYAEWWVQSTRVTVAVGLVGAALALARARVTHGLHTLAQVVAGLAFGAAAAVAWWCWGDAVLPVVVMDGVMEGPWRMWKAVLVAGGVVGGLSVRWNSALRPKAS